MSRRAFVLLLMALPFSTGCNGGPQDVPATNLNRPIPTEGAKPPGPGGKASKLGGDTGPKKPVS
jgi:hypothetical protein